MSDLVLVLLTTVFQLIVTIGATTTTLSIPICYSDGDESKVLTGLISAFDEIIEITKAMSPQTNSVDYEIKKYIVNNDNNNDNFGWTATVEATELNDETYNIWKHWENNGKICKIIEKQIDDNGICNICDYSTNDDISNNDSTNIINNSNNSNNSDSNIIDVFYNEKLMIVLFGAIGFILLLLIGLILYVIYQRKMAIKSRNAYSDLEIEEDDQNTQSHVVV